MPKLPTDYSKTQIYKIVCKDTAITSQYIGHTTLWRCRKSNHKRACNIPENKDYNALIYKTIRDNGGWDNWEMIEIEKYPCADANEARARERYWTEQLTGGLNRNRPIITEEEANIRRRDYMRKLRAEG
jgi:hypothetical protein